MDYRVGLKIAREKLRSIALAGETEASVIVDCTTGAHLDFQVGQKDEVTPDWSKIPAGAAVTVLHVHSENIAFGPEDWDALANQEAVLEIHAVCPDEIHVLRKPDDWGFQAFCCPGISVLGSLFKRKLAQVWSEAAFADSRYPSVSAARIAQIAETNRRMIHSHAGKGFKLSKE